LSEGLLERVASGSLARSARHRLARVWQRDLARTLSANLGTSLIIQASTVVTGVLLARELGPKGRGELAIAMLVPMLVAALGTVSVYDAVTYHAARREATPAQLLGSSMALAAVQGCLLVLIAAAILPFVVSPHGHKAVQAAFVYALYIPLSLASRYLVALLNGLGRYTAFNAARFVNIGVAVIGIASLAVAGRLSLIAVVLVYLAAEVATIIVGLAGCRRSIGERPRVDRGLIARLLRYGAKIHVGGVSLLLNERLDQLIISLFLGAADLGLYVIAVTLTSATALVGYSVAFAALPSVAALPPGEGRRRRAAALVGATVAASTAITLPLLVFTPQIIELFFGSSFRPASSVTRVLLVAAIVLSTNRALGAIAKALGRPLLAGTAELVALGGTFVGLATLLPALGLIGAGWASMISYTLSFCVMAYALNRSRVAAKGFP
jgi:O-antigen/teichoic acid export membrane protein